jgi:Na+-translocating ferredoxin:NAD+ oxidoreductase RnfG subunit
MTRIVIGSILALLAVAVAAVSAVAHVTPPVVLVSDREAVVGLLGGARRYFVREVTLRPEQQQQVRQRSGWKPDDAFYRFYVGRDEQGRLVGTMLFLTDYTIHGPVRVAVGLGADGKVRGATVVELTEETYPWVKPLLDQRFTQQYVGLDSGGTFVPQRIGDGMTQFYGQIIAGLIHRATILYDVASPPEAKTSMGRRPATDGMPHLHPEKG